MTSDDRFDETLDAMAREYNSAPAVPRDEMWAAIAAARKEAGREQAAPAAPVVVIPMRPRPMLWRWAAAGGALAATLLIGFAIGRTTRPSGLPQQQAVARAPQAAQPTSEPASQTTVANAEPNTGEPGPVQGPQRPVERGAATLASATPGRDRAPSRNDRDASLPYRVAAMEHLMTTEALLVSLRSDVRAGRRDTTIAGWADNLLGTTRMLMDSPASRDPQMKQLLEDLELVLAQIARLPGARGEAADLGLIDDAVQRRQLMTRLRAITPGT